MSKTDLQSTLIGFLRFPLIVGVVLIHSRLPVIDVPGVNYPPEADLTVYTTISTLISTILTRIAVPLFFFFSGFLFFYKIKEFSTKIYFQKLERRSKTILVPYIFWNLATVLVFFIAQTYFRGAMTGTVQLVADYNISDWLRVFWDIRAEDHVRYPMSYQFWFLRDLMIVILFSPLIYFLIKQFKYIPVILLGILWFFNCGPHIIGINPLAFFMFSTGAYFSINNDDFIERLKPLTLLVLISYPLIVVSELWFKNAYLDRCGIITGMICAILVSAYFLKKGSWHSHPLLSNSSFFIYAYFAIPISFIGRMVVRIIPLSDLSMTVLYLFCPAVIILIGLQIFILLKRYLPTLAEIITGGR